MCILISDTKPSYDLKTHYDIAQTLVKVLKKVLLVTKVITKAINQWKILG